MYVTQEQEDDAQLWKDLKDLQPGDILPANMPELFYTRLHSLLMCGCYADRIHPFLQEFPHSKYVFISSDNIATVVLHDPEVFIHACMP